MFLIETQKEQVSRIISNSLIEGKVLTTIPKRTQSVVQLYSNMEH